MRNSSQEQGYVWHGPTCHDLLCSAYCSYGADGLDDETVLVIDRK